MTAPVENSTSSFTSPSENPVFTFARVDPESLEVTIKYNTNGGDRWSPEDIECTIPFDVLADMATKDSEGTIQLLEDPTKVAAKTEAQWNSVRAQQSDLLYKSDWTCSVVDPPAPILAQRDQWIAYRAALRDVTTQSDPFNIVWPAVPSV